MYPMLAQCIGYTVVRTTIDSIGDSSKVKERNYSTEKPSIFRMFSFTIHLRIKAHLCRHSVCPCPRTLTRASIYFGVTTCGILCRPNSASHKVFYQDTNISAWTERKRVSR